ncbi:MAG: phosphopantetheine-binding protein [Bacteroidales bacterium]|nr:phosphopantetheine-binding protein [Bacteroidales bacterium]
MNNNEIKEIVLNIIKKYTLKKEELENLPENPHIINDLKINSARIVEIIIDIEEKFNIEIENELLKKINYLNDIIDIIKSKVEKKNN